MDLVSKFTGRSLLAAGLGVALFAAATPAQSMAADFEGSADSEFGDGSKQVTYEGDADSYFKLIDPSDFSANLDNPFHLTTVEFSHGSDFKWIIWPIFGVPEHSPGGEYTESVTSTLSFDTPDGLGDQVLEYEFDLDLAYNSGSDEIELNMGDFTPTQFTFNGTIYELELLGFYDGFKYGEMQFTNKFKVREGKTESKWLKAQFTEVGQVTVVPLPAAAWGGMALLGLLGVAQRVRRNRQTA